MNNHEQLYNEDENDYDREPPLDGKTTNINRNRSKYVFTTLCFLLALVLFYTYLNGTFAGDSSSSWFPLIGSLVLAVLGVIFLRSSDTQPEQPASSLSSLSETSEREAGQKQAELSPFEELVQEALASIPEQFREKMDNIAVRVAYEPEEEVLRRVGVQEGHILLGLYEGIPLTASGRENATYMEVITIYQHPIEQHCHYDPQRIREQVRTTVLHEVAHHFGMEHKEMPIWLNGS